MVKYFERKVGNKDEIDAESNDEINISYIRERR